MNYWEAVGIAVNTGKPIRHQMWPKHSHVVFDAAFGWRTSWGANSFEMQLAGKEDGWELFDPPIDDLLGRAKKALDEHGAGVLECRIALGFIIQHLERDHDNR